MAWAPRTAWAIPYEVFIEIETEEDLYDLLVTGQISDASFDALLLLFQTRVTLNDASREQLYLLPNLRYSEVDRILAFREETGFIQSLEQLVVAGALEQRIARSLAEFVALPPAPGLKPQSSGFIRAEGRWSGRYDRLPPAAALQARFGALGKLDVGLVAILTRNRLRRVRWDPAREGLSVKPESARLELPKAYFAWQAKRWKLVVGTYRIGFGQRLTFDVTDQATPNGPFGDYEVRRAYDLTLRCKRAAGERLASPCPRNRIARVTPDFGWTNRLAGVALGSKSLSVGPGWFRMFLWGSVQPHRVRSVKLVAGRRCPDPRQDDQPGCRPPSVFVRGRDPRTASPTATYATLPAVALEGLAGLHLAYFWEPRVSLGVSGYGAATRWRLDGVALDYQETARKPSGGPFGAVGVHASFGFRRQDFFAELTRSIDRQPGGGGGFAAIVRSVTNVDAGELDISIRYYDPRFSNPYARPIASADQLDGLAARDEAGIRIRGAWHVGSRLDVRFLLDGWRQLVARAAAAARLFARIDTKFGARVRWSWWIDHRTAGVRTLVATKLAFSSRRGTSVSAQLQSRWLRGSPTGKPLQQDLAAVLTFMARPGDMFRIRLRGRYDFEHVRNNQRFPQTLWIYLETTLMLRQRSTLRVRYDFRIFLDERESTKVRAPNPEHWLALEYAFRY